MGFLDNSSITVDAILTKRGREILSQGGNFNITKFRELTEQNKQVNLLYSPLASIVPQIEILNNDFNKPNLINLHQKTTKNNFFNN